MSNPFTDALFEALLNYVQYSDRTANIVTHYEESPYVNEVTITYETVYGDVRLISYHGTFGELVQELADV